MGVRIAAPGDCRSLPSHAPCVENGTLWLEGQRLFTLRPTEPRVATAKYDEPTIVAALFEAPKN
jgi:hypothetical protein